MDVAVDVLEGSANSIVVLPHQETTLYQDICEQDHPRESLQTRVESPGPELDGLPPTEIEEG